MDTSVVEKNSTTTTVILTELAAHQVKEAMVLEGAQGQALRVGVKGGGCSGLQYLLDFAETPLEDDLVDEQHGVKLFIDPFSAEQLSGTVIDFVDDLNGTGFKFENPNVSNSCGCGNSCNCG
ncbi:MAG: hypothetical protein A2289_14875 [Deltaproteobacteria bacterium RIFOXYA12_FULL_58_15]|nr:MAG: hypothetical protein A2289_14875 [Deltaproteobacteria bacterium RIFOXYA12_FULL_58_15]OGR09774.1 MAG: hypothetical protein A2341_13175 [Deltaproteobacteria bacterium RIFOXYB12_FULL_58_9]